MQVVFMNMMCNYSVPRSAAGQTWIRCKVYLWHRLMFFSTYCCLLWFLLQISFSYYVVLMSLFNAILRGEIKIFLKKKLVGFFFFFCLVFVFVALKHLSPSLADCSWRNLLGVCIFLCNAQHQRWLTCLNWYHQENLCSGYFSHRQCCEKVSALFLFLHASDPQTNFNRQR